METGKKIFSKGKWACFSIPYNFMLIHEFIELGKTKKDISYFTSKGALCDFLRKNSSFRIDELRVLLLNVPEAPGRNTDKNHC